MKRLSRRAGLAAATALSTLALTALTLLGPTMTADPTTATAADAAEAHSAHGFDFTAIDGRPMPLSDYAGRPLLVVNTASFCGFTHQYEGLQTVWQAYRDRGLVVIGVPSNDFGNQEPGSEAEIKAFCEGTYSVDFPMTDKQVVVGGAAHPLYRWVVDLAGEGAAPRWNFHKYLFDRSGTLVEVWPASVRPDSPQVTEAIETVLAAAPAS